MIEAHLYIDPFEFKVRRCRLTLGWPWVERHLVVNHLKARPFQSFGFRCVSLHPYIKVGDLVILSVTGLEGEARCGGASSTLN